MPERLENVSQLYVLLIYAIAINLRLQYNLDSRLLKDKKFFKSIIFLKQEPFLTLALIAY